MTGAAGHGRTGQGRWLDRVSPRVVLAAAFLTGLALVLIGLRFLFDPLNAATFFGVARDNPGLSLHHAIAYRDLWLGLMAMAFALLRDWRALAVWLALGALVCLADAGIAAASSQRWISITFHLVSGVFCGALAWLCHHRYLTKSRQKNA